MGSLTIRRLDDAVKRRLRLRAASHGRSMEEEARQLLSEALEGPVASEHGLGTAIHGRFAALGGVDLDLPQRERMREPPDFG